MSKGVLASVAALTASAGMAFGQGAPGAAPQTFPTWGGATAGPVQATPMGRSTGATNYLPNAVDMPQNGVVGGGPTYYPGFETTFGGEGGGAYDGMQNPQIHKAAGGPDKLWLDIEHIAWAVRSMPIPFPLAVRSPAASAGLLNQPGTEVIFGNENVDYGTHFNVLRLTGGFWWGCDRKWGSELSGFIQEAKSETAEFSAPIGGRQVLARPLIDALTGQISAVLVGFPGQFSGDMFINARLKMGGGEANVLRSVVYCDRIKLNLLAGLRYLDHDETLQITSRSTFPNLNDPLDPTIVDIFDEFACRNQFVGAQLGFEGELRHRRFFTNVIAKCAVGNQNERLSVRGFTNNRTLGIDSTTPGGMLALAGNITDESNNEFAYVPEFTIKFGYQWTQRLSTYIGYNGLYISRLMRPGDQIDPVINPTLLPVSNLFGLDFPPVRPLNQFNQSDFWTQGVTFGLSIRY